MPYLEPIEDADLDLKAKLTSENLPKTVMGLPKEKKAEMIIQPEVGPGRKEGSAEKEKTYSKILSKIKTHTRPIDDEIASDAKTASDEDSAQNKVEKLVQLAMHKGVVHAVKVARHLEDNYILDEFHDRLMVQEFHDALVKKGLIKEI